MGRAGVAGFTWTNIWLRKLPMLGAVSHAIGRRGIVCVFEFANMRGSAGVQVVAAAAAMMATLRDQDQSVEIVFGTSTDDGSAVGVATRQNRVDYNAHWDGPGNRIGVTGVGDDKGAGNLHQIDNKGGYTDFVLLEFNRAVTLGSVKINSYGIGGVVDDDAVWFDASTFTTSTWDFTAGFTNYRTVPGIWDAVATGGSNVARATGATTASTKWLVGAAFTPLNNRNDGFKLASINVSEQVAAVPEPETWATMILGFGVAGAALRRGRRRTALAVRFA